MRTQKYQQLVDDCEELFRLAVNDQFSDFGSDFAFPKVELVKRLEAMREKAVTGEYDD